MENVNNKVDPGKKQAEKNEDRKNSLFSDRPCSDQASRCEKEEVREKTNLMKMNRQEVVPMFFRNFEDNEEISSHANNKHRCEQQSVKITSSGFFSHVVLLCLFYCNVVQSLTADIFEKLAKSVIVEQWNISMKEADYDEVKIYFEIVLVVIYFGCYFCLDFLLV